MTSFPTSCFVMLVTTFLICTVSCSCTCSLMTKDVEYTRKYQHHLRTDLLHPNVCVAARDPFLYHSEETATSELEPWCCQGFWRRVQLMLDDGESYMPTAYHCRQVNCPNQNSL